MSPAAPRREAAVRAAWAVSDALVVCLSLAVAGWLRLDFDLAATARWEIVAFAATGGVAHLAIGTVLALVSRRHPRGSFEETLQVTVGTVFLSVVLVVLRYGTPWLDVPRSLPVTGPLLALTGMLSLRFVVRSYRWGGARREHPAKPTIVYGAGAGGRQLLRTLSRGNEDVPFRAVAILDDDGRKRRWRLEGTRVRGGFDQLQATVDRTSATSLVIAAPSMPADRKKAIHDAGLALGLEVLVLPSVDELLRSPGAADLRQLNLADLLGRRQVALDETAISHVVMGKRVLVTGAGGSIGSELARQITRFSPARLVLLDRDESALHSCQLRLTGRALLDDDTLALVDIRDQQAVRRVMQRERPDVVFHAAALKHLSLLESHPDEAWKTNVLGTLAVLDESHSVGVSTFVNISTDKAASPTSVLGYSKRIAERLTASFAARDESTYVSVRFGNVLGSRGSMLETFTEQIAAGGPVTVTHPEVERYFMLIPEASQLVLQAAAIGCDGEAMVLDMGEPVRIVDVARTLIHLSGRPSIEIDFTGLRPGEKLTEVLFDDDDGIQQSAHPLVRHVPVPALEPTRVREPRVEDCESASTLLAALGGGRPSPPRRADPTTNGTPSHTPTPTDDEDTMAERDRSDQDPAAVRTR